MAARQSTGDGEYGRAMVHAAELYADVLAGLGDAGYDAAIIQTGGMCLAIEIRVKDGRTILVTDKDEILPWNREWHQGWGIGVYSESDDRELIQSVLVDGRFAICPYRCACTVEMAINWLCRARYQRVVATA
jgi:hypothetical protein